MQRQDREIKHTRVCRANALAHALRLPNLEANKYRAETAKRSTIG